MKLVKLWAICTIAMVFAACDANKNKVEELAKQYVQAFNEKDEVILNDLYPNAKTYSVLQPVDSIYSTEVKVEFNEQDSVYIAILNDKQYLVVKVEEEEAKIMDSYQVLKLDSAAYELAIITSAPITKQSDLTNGKLIEELKAELEAQRPKTIVIDGKNMLWGTNYWSHVELAPDGTLTGEALFPPNNLFGEDVTRTFTGSWHTGSISRGTTYITYYELNIDDLEWYFTENFDYIWQGTHSYTDMCHNNIDHAGVIVTKTEK